jgi:hypothetical protein
MEARAVGFGFRPWAWRDHLARSEDDYAPVLTRFFGQMDDYSLQPEDFQTSVTGEIGLAWGVYLEQWQEKGQPPEQARVRFSKVLTKGARLAGTALPPRHPAFYGRRALPQSTDSDTADPRRGRDESSPFPIDVQEVAARLGQPSSSHPGSWPVLIHRWSTKSARCFEVLEE